MTPIRTLSVISAFLIITTPLFANIQNFADGDFDTFGAGYESSSDTYNVGVNMSNTSTNSAQWDTTLAILNFVQNTSIGGSFSNTVHTLDYTSGANLGQAVFPANNFTWGTVDVNVGNTLNFTTGALYTRALTLGGGNLAAAISQLSGFTGSGILYYDSTNPANAYLFDDFIANGNTPLSFGSGGLVAPVPIPEPGTILFGIVAGAIAARSGFSWHRNRNRK